MEFLTEETTMKLRKINTERYRHANKKEIEVGDIIIGRYSISKIIEVNDHFVTLLWENDILAISREKLYHKNLLRQKLRIGEWKIYKEVFIGDLNI